ncbi:phosphate ABC transporter ATP-binding protein [candidate division WOR-3 bacterium JGI_Cruoil_03_44_89]|uniref:Phosphate ABC transporter ATP-binding protein n=1 Tax=candidate division WOR-3 bacterium JGI_Cruoil_03_44_89 TaxID=1973748 RepID=A0A235BYE8_UNCW3|nr:MAG: phosphate ABC transporter ATP-binding protein [candidate division WOR-3 bacterium JGI_Cruoil_03_44_89]
MVNKDKITTENLNLWFGKNHVLKDINIGIEENKITAIIGPSGCGKSTFLRCLNRMNDLIDNTKITGKVSLGGENVYNNRMDVVTLRRRVGMVFQKPNPFPKSIFENVAYPLRIQGVRNGISERVRKALSAAALWNEVKDRLNISALSLSGGQQQRLCIARALVTEPEVILMDEPCSALDPIATAKIEELLFTLKEQYTICIVTHNMQQAARVSECAAFLLLGELIEFNNTNKIFTNPADKRTEDYITGRFG